MMKTNKKATRIPKKTCLSRPDNGIRGCVIESKPFADKIVKVGDVVAINDKDLKAFLERRFAVSSYLAVITKVYSVVRFEIQVMESSSDVFIDVEYQHLDTTKL